MNDKRSGSSHRSREYLGTTDEVVKHLTSTDCRCRDISDGTGSSTPCNSVADERGAYAAVFSSTCRQSEEGKMSGGEKREGKGGDTQWLVYTWHVRNLEKYHVTKHFTCMRVRNITLRSICSGLGSEPVEAPPYLPVGGRPHVCLGPHVT